MDLSYGYFKYVIENGGITITGIIGDTPKIFIIPKSINGLIVEDVSLDTDKYVTSKRFIYKVKYLICDDFVIYDAGYIMGGVYLRSNFINNEHIITKLINGEHQNSTRYEFRL